MSENPVKEITKGISERLSDPFLGCLTISFIFWNWKFIFILFFSSGTATGRMYLALLEFNCINGFLVPIVFALFYVLIWRTFVPKGLDIFKDYIEKILDRFDLRGIINEIKLKNEIYYLQNIIIKYYSMQLDLSESYLTLIDINKLDDSKDEYLIGFKGTDKKYYALHKYNGHVIEYFYFVVLKSRGHLLLYRSINNKLEFPRKIFVNMEVVLNGESYKQIFDKYLSLKMGLIYWDLKD